MKTNENKSWVDRELRIYNPCFSALKEARKYPDAQTAWNAWGSADELIWTLVRLRAGTDRLLLCCNELTHPLIGPMRYRYKNETVESYVGAIDAVCEWARNPQTENRREIDFYYDDVVGWDWDYPLARVVEKLVLAVERPHKLIDLPDIVKTGVFQEVRDGWKHPFVPEIDNADLTAAQYDRWQCNIVRNFFPVTPFIKAYR